jgi:hypothetical protein
MREKEYYVGYQLEWRQRSRTGAVFRNYREHLAEFDVSQEPKGLQAQIMYQ